MNLAYIRAVRRKVEEERRLGILTESEFKRKHNAWRKHIREELEKTHAKNLHYKTVK